MHEQWRDLIPFYVAGALSREEASSFEQHLRTCEACGRMLEEWRLVARIVKAETDVYSRKLPPLAQHIREEMNQSRGGVYPVTHLSTGEYGGKDVRRRGAPLRLPAMAAAIIIVFLLGGLIVYIAAQSVLRLEEVDLTQVAALVTVSPMPDVTIEQGAGEQGGGQDLGILPVETEPPQAVGTPDRPIQPTITGIAPTIESIGPSVTPFSTEMLGMMAVQECVVTPNTDFQGDPMVSVNIHSSPSEASELINSFNTNSAVTAIAQSDTGWYRVRFVIWTTAWIGWVPANVINLQGSCENLPMLRAEGYTPEPTPFFAITPTAQFGSNIGMGQYDVITLEAVGNIPANTRVRVGSAWYDGTNWWYSIATEDEQTFAEARESQLGFVTPDAPMPTPQ